jgi:hypothetical protein
MTVDPPLSSWPEYWVVDTQQFFVIHSFILQILHHELISLVKACTFVLLEIAELVACLPMAQAAYVQFSPHSFLFSF